MTKWDLALGMDRDTGVLHYGNHPHFQVGFGPLRGIKCRSDEGGVTGFRTS